MEQEHLTAAVATMHWHNIMHCPMNDVPFQTLNEYAVSHNLTETVPVPGNLSIKERRALIDTLLVLRSWRLLWSLHMRSLTLGGHFNASNFTVDSELSVRLNGILLIELKEENGDLDYYQFVKVVLEEVFVHEQIPRGVLRWLRLICNGMEGYGYLICYHTCVMEHHQAVTYHMSLNRKFLELETTNKSLFYKIISWLDQYDCWQSRQTTSANMLVDSARSFIPPGKKYPTFYHDDVRGVLKLARDCWQHPALFFEGFFVLIIGEDFPWLFADFQEAMHDAGQVGQLHLQTSMW